MNAPYYLLRGGDLYDSSLERAGSWGYYWSSTPGGSRVAYVLYVYSGGTYVGDPSRYYGRSVRCVALSTLPVSYTHLDVYKRQPYRSESL